MPHGLPYAEVLKIKKEFISAGHLRELWPPYVFSVGVSKVKYYDNDAEDGEDFCIHIVLVEPLPKGAAIVSEFRGVKVFPQLV